MNSKLSSLPALVLFCAGILLTTGASRTFAAGSVSPDKQWEYRCAEGYSPQIIKAGTTEVALSLLEDQSVPDAESAEVIWSPDSKRFAFNYSPPHKPHSSYDTIALYQLRDDKWVAMPSPVDGESERSQLLQLAGTHFAKSRSLRRAELLRDILKVRSWTDANTAILYAHSVWVGTRSPDANAAFLFTLKFDASGKSKIIKTQNVSAKETGD
jgi:hypothetical protein